MRIAVFSNRRQVAFAILLGLTSGVLWGRESSAEAAEERTPMPAHVETAPPAAEDIRRMIQDLGSVRDYERLHWILQAVERQVPPVRAELLKTLDEQVQQLFQAEVELRTATALASLQPVLASAPPDSQQTRDVAPAPASASPERFEAMDLKTDRIPWVQAQAYQDVQQQIEQATFASDPKERMEQMSRLTDRILGVEGREQREQLFKRLDERSTQVLLQQMQTHQVEISDTPGESVDEAEEHL